MRQFWIPSIGFLLACHAAGHTTRSPEPDDQRQVPTVLDTPVDFSGSPGATLDPAQLDEIRIGLFAPTDGSHSVGGPMYKAARLAVEQVNDRGGFAGVPFRIVARWDDDPWRGGSKQMIKLVYEDSVWAVIGSASGEGTHIAEQVITKAWLPLLSPVSTDPTLTYIRIPWMFRLPPNDQAQAEVLVRDGLQKLSLERVGLITSTDHDGRIFAEDMLDQMRTAGTPATFHFEVTPENFNTDKLVRRGQSFSPEGVVIRLPKKATLALLDKLQLLGVAVPVLLPWIPGLQPADLEDHYDSGIFYVQPFATTANSRYERFAETYRERYGSAPTPSAAYSYDAVNLIVRSLDESGLSRAALRDVISNLNGYYGVTGAINWDNAGGNKAPAVLMRRD